MSPPASRNRSRPLQRNRVDRAPPNALTRSTGGGEPLKSTARELAAMIRDGVPKYAAIVKAAGVKPE